MRSVLIAMAGLPGTGKSTIAGELAQRLDAIVLSKDDIRGRLFPAEEVHYTREQDDFCMDAIFLIADHVLKAKPEQILIIDGRTFTRSCQVSHLVSQAHALNAMPLIIECVCDDAIARQRIERDLRTGTHPAANRSCELHRDLKEKAEPITIEHLVIDTGAGHLNMSVEQCLAYVKSKQ